MNYRQLFQGNEQSHLLMKIRFHFVMRRGNSTRHVPRVGHPFTQRCNPTASQFVPGKLDNNCEVVYIP